MLWQVIWGTFVSNDKRPTDFRRLPCIDSQTWSWSFAPYFLSLLQFLIMKQVSSNTWQYLPIFRCKEISWRREYPHFNPITLRNWVNHVAPLDFGRAGAILCLSYSGWSQTVLMHLQLNSRGVFPHLEKMKSFRNIWANNKFFFLHNF